jgi:transcriptional regulator with XRE-family HTH domain
MTQMGLSLEQGAKVSDPSPEGDGPSPALARRRLAAGLRGARKARGLTTDGVADHTRLAPARVNRMETGRLVPSPPELHRLLTLYQVPADERAGLLRLHRQASQPGWWTAYADVLHPAALATYLGFEAAAATLHAYEPTVVHGLLQIRSYARAILAAAHPRDTEATLDRRVRLAMARQAVLTRGAHPLRLHLVLDEAALHHHIGGEQVLRAQLHRLAEEATQPAVTIQVLPFHAGAHRVLRGAFGVLTFPDPADDPVAYTESITGMVILAKPAAAARLGGIFEQLAAAAASPHDSMTLIADLAQRARQHSESAHEDPDRSRANPATE